MQTVIILVHLMIVLAMVGLVLIQKSEGGGLGMGSGGGGGFLSSRSSANVLTRSTAILAALFFATSLFLSRSSVERRLRRLVDDADSDIDGSVPAPRPRWRLAHAAGGPCGGGVAQRRAQSVGTNTAPCRARHATTCGHSLWASCHVTPLAWRRARSSSRAWRRARRRHLLATAAPGCARPRARLGPSSASSRALAAVTAHRSQRGRRRC